jgi:hypothetical protein
MLAVAVVLLKVEVGQAVVLVPVMVVHQAVPQVLIVAAVAVADKADKTAATVVLVL